MVDIPTHPQRLNLKWKMHTQMYFSIKEEHVPGFVFQIHYGRCCIQVMWRHTWTAAITNRLISGNVRYNFSLHRWYRCYQISDKEQKEKINS